MTEHYLDRLERTINANWSQPALSDFYLTDDGSAQDTSRGNHYTYGEMYCEMLRLGEMFAALGLQKGDHIAICGANSAHWAIAYLAIAACQCVSVSIMHSQSIDDIAHQMKFSDAKALLTDPELWLELKDRPHLQPNHVISLSDWSLYHSISDNYSNVPTQLINRQSTDSQPTVNPINTTITTSCHFVHGELDDLAMICFTSGSTGLSKGVMLTYRNISNNAQNVHDIFPKSENRACFVTLPIAHMYSMSLEFIGQLCRAKTLYILGIMAAADALRALEIRRPYMLCTVPAILESLIRYDKEQALCLLGKLEHIQIGGAKLESGTEDILSENHIRYSIGYGTSETAPLIAMCTAFEYRKRSVGTIVGGMEASIHPSTCEILVKGENVMLGYYKDPEATAQKIDQDGWLHTGDRGHLDEDGYLYVEGRIEQDMIVLPNGENIHPEDIERKINALPEVKESIVLARDGKLVAIVVADTDIRRHILRTVNPDLPFYSQLYDVEITDTPLQKTEKQTLKRYLYK